MSEPAKDNVIDQWLQTEATVAPDCKVVAAFAGATHAMKINEGAALAKLRNLYDEPPAALGHVTAETN